MVALGRMGASGSLNIDATTSVIGNLVHRGKTIDFAKSPVTF